MVQRARQFQCYFTPKSREFAREVLAHSTSPHTLQSTEVPNFLESCSWRVENEILAIKGLLGGFTKRLEKLEPMLLSMPFPPRDACRQAHVLNGIPPRAIARGLERKLWKDGELPENMVFTQEQLKCLLEDIELSEGPENLSHPEPILLDDEKEDPVRPVENYYDEAEAVRQRAKAKKIDKELQGKKILEDKDGVVKLSFPSYHLKVMTLLADKNLFGKTFKPYKKSYQKHIYRVVADSHGDEMVEKFTLFLQESYAAYEAIFVEGKRSVFGPADVKADVSQHLAQLVHYFKAQLFDKL